MLGRCGETLSATTRMAGARAAVRRTWLAGCRSVLPPSGRRARNSIQSDVLRGGHDDRRGPPSGRRRFGDGSRTAPSVVSRNRDYLGQTLGFSEGHLDAISNTKGMNFLTLDTGVLEERVRWLTARLDLKESEMKKMAQKQPDILKYQTKENFAPKLEYLQTRLLLDDNSLRKMILSAPNILAFSIKESIEPKLDWLQQRLDLENAEVSKMIQKCPALCSCSVDANLGPTLDWLQQRLHVGNGSASKIIPAVSKVVQKCPNILFLNVDTNLEPTLHWLQRRLSLDDASVSKMIQKIPALLCYNVDDNVEPKLNWLQQSLDLDEAAVSDMIQKLPALLSYSIDANLAPTLNFYVDALGKEEALRMVVPDPSLFGYSLKNRLEPRLEEARAAGIKIDPGCLQRIAKYTQVRWDASMLYYISKKQFPNS